MTMTTLRRVRWEVFERAAVLQALVDEHGYNVTAAQVTEAAHREKAWHGLRSQLEPEQVREARERGEGWSLRYEQYIDVLRRIGRLERLPQRVDDVEDAIEYLWRLVSRLGRLPPLRPLPTRLNPRSRLRDLDGLFAGWEAEVGLVLPPELLAELMGIVGDLVEAFKKQLEEVGKFELPPILPAPVRVEFRIPGRRDRAAGPPGVLEPGAMVGEIGETVVLTASVAGGASATVTSPTLPGPSVVERIMFSQSAGVAGTLEIRAQGAGVTGATGVGDALLQGETGAVVAVQAVAFFGDWWPRRLVRANGFQVFIRYANNGAALNRIMVGVDRRDILWPD